MTCCLLGDLAIENLSTLLKYFRKLSVYIEQDWTFTYKLISTGKCEIVENNYTFAANGTTDKSDKVDETRSKWNWSSIISLQQNP